MKTVGEVKFRLSGHIGLLKGMRVLPPKCRNIRNIINIYKKTYKKHIDKQQPPSTVSRNISEHTGTFFVELFCKCSGKTTSQNTPQGLMDKGLQTSRVNICSGLFRLGGHIAKVTESHRKRGLQRLSLSLFRMFRGTDGYTRFLNANA